jgi:hypothetical protein
VPCDRGLPLQAAYTALAEQKIADTQMLVLLTHRFDESIAVLKDMFQRQGWDSLEFNGERYRCFTPERFEKSQLQQASKCTKAKIKTDKQFTPSLLAEIKDTMKYEYWLYLLAGMRIDAFNRARSENMDKWGRP